MADEIPGDYPDIPEELRGSATTPGAIPIMSQWFECPECDKTFLGVPDDDRVVCDFCGSTIIASENTTEV